MFNISNYLQKLTKNLNSTEFLKRSILSIIYKQTNLTFEEGDIEIKNYILNIKSSLAQKNKIFLYKQSILEDIEKTLETKIIDIR